MDQFETILEQMKTKLTITTSSNTSQTEICPICNNNYWVVNDGIARRCKCFEKEIIKRRLSFANLPEVFKDYTIKNFTWNAYKSQDSKKIVQGIVTVVNQYLNELDEQIQSNKGFYFWSRTKGCGKTRLMASFANELMEKHNKRIKFCTSIALLNEIKKTWEREKKNDYTESKLIEELVTTPILIIDDFGTEQVKDWIDERFYNIINERYINKKVTFYTSNLSISDLQYNDRITNRIKETSYELHFPEESIREYIGADNMKNLFEKRSV